MLALVPRNPVPAGAARRDLVEQVIVRLEPEAAEATGAALDAAALAALGWEVRAEPRARQPAWRCRSPWATHWLPVPAVSANATLCAEYIVPWRWDYGAGVREGKPFAWVRLTETLWFEATGTTPARCLLKAALHGHRALLLEMENSHA